MNAISCDACTPQIRKKNSIILSGRLDPRPAHSIGSTGLRLIVVILSIFIVDVGQMLFRCWQCRLILLRCWHFIRFGTFVAWLVRFHAPNILCPLPRSALLSNALYGILLLLILLISSINVREKVFDGYFWRVNQLDGYIFGNYNFIRCVWK